MGSLAHCLRKHAGALRPGDVAYIEKRAAELEADGNSPRAAAELAVLEMLAEETQAGRQYAAEVHRQGGAPPDGFVAALEDAERKIAAGPQVPESERPLRIEDLPDPRRVVDPDARARAQRDRELAPLVGNGFTRAQVEVLRTRATTVPRDRVTGLHRAEELDAALDAALLLADEGAPSAYVETDLQNLGGLNAALGASGADVHLRAFADAIEGALRGVGAQDVVLVRKGGDEVGAIVVGVDPGAVDAAMQVARQRFAEHARREGIDRTPHPKGRAAGVGMHFGTAAIRPGLTRGAVLREADTLLEARKEGQPYGEFGSTAAARAGTAGGRDPEAATAGAGRGAQGDRGGERAGISGARRGQGRAEGEAPEVGGFYRETATPAAEPLDRAALERLVAATRSRSGIEIHVVARPDDPSLPPAARGRQMQAQGYSDGRAVWLFANNLASIRHAQNVLAHEVVGHLGVEAITTQREWAGIRAAVIAIGEADAMLGETPDAVRQAVRAAWRRYADQPLDRRVREAIAVMAERGIGGSLWDRVVAALRRALRTLVPRLGWTPAELRALVARAARARPQAPAEAVQDGTGGDFYAKGFDPDDPGDAGRLLASVPGRLPEADAGWMQRLGDVVDTQRHRWLDLLTRAQIVEVGRDVLPEAQAFERTARRMEADANKLSEPAAKLAMRWSALMFGINANRAEAAELAALMHDATIYETDPTEPIKNRPQLSERAAYSTLRRRWEALSPTAQAIYREVRDAYAKRRDEFESALLERIDRATVAEDKKAQMRAKLRAEFEQSRSRGPYFPLGRFGDYWIAASRGADTQFVLTESQGEQREVVRELQRLGWDVRAGKKISRLAADPPPGAGFIAEVVTLIDDADLDSDLADQLRDSVYQLYLENLPDASVRKSYIHRKGTPGFSRDALRVFAHHMTHGARQLARLRHADVLAAQVRRMAEAAPRAPDPNKAADIVAALDKSYDWMMNPSTATWASRATSLGFMWYLGVSPAAALINASQQAMIAYPFLGARYGFDTAAGALAAANRDYLRAITKTGRAGLENERDGDVGRMLSELEASGAIDRTQTMSLAGLSDENAGLSIIEQRFMRVVGWAFQQVERMNREAVALATYRMARDRGDDHATAVQAAYDAVFATQYDYSSGNRARFMRPDIAKVALLFKQYAQNTTYFLARATWEAFKADSPTVRDEARRRLAATVGMAGLFGGALGMPLAKVMLVTLSFAFGLMDGDDDEEEFDAQTEFRAWLTRTFGATWGEVLATGPMNALTQADIASRTNVDPVALWIRPPNRELEGKDLALWGLEQLAGPVFGIAASWATGAQLVSEGHVARGVETMLPKAARDVIKSERFHREGVLTLRGDPVIDDPTTWETMLQGLGFTPARISNAYRDINAMKRMEGDLDEKRTRLMADFGRSLLASDRKATELAMTRIVAWNERFPDLAITREGLRRSIQSRAQSTGRMVGGVPIAPQVQRRYEQAFEPAKPKE